MKLKTFFEKFDQFADAPDAVAKMRELVLELAVQGKLVDRKKGDGNAVQLLDEISREREARAAMLRTPKEPSLDENSEHAFQIPPTWVWTQLGNIALQIQYGYTASADHSSTEVRMLRITDIQNNRVNWSTVPGCQITKSEAEKYLLIPNDILIARTGGTIGKSFIIPDAPVRSVFASYLIRVTPPAAMEARFLKIFLETPFYWKQLQAMSAGTGQPNVNGQALGRLELPLPPLAEQKRIVAKVDELMALCDRLEAQQQERDEQASALARASLARFAEAPTPANLNLLFHKSYSIAPADLGKAILQLAFAGKLVPQDPKDEPASVLLEKARAEKARLIAKGIVKKEPWAHKLQNATNLYELPTGWEWTHVSDVVEKVTVGFVGSMKEQYVKDGVPFLRCQNVRANRYEPVGLTFISDKFHQSISKSTLRPGDVVVTRSGNVGVSCVIPESLPEANCSDLVVVKRPLAILPVFLSYFINSIAAGQIEAKTVGVALTHFNTQSVAQMTVALPPLAEQRRIVAKVDQLMALVDQLETQLADSRAGAKNLLDALVGELTSTH